MNSEHSDKDTPAVDLNQVTPSLNSTTNQAYSLAKYITFEGNLMRQPK